MVIIISKPMAIKFSGIIRGYQATMGLVMSRLYKSSSLFVLMWELKIIKITAI